MKALLASLLFGLLFTEPFASAEVDIRQVAEQFKIGASRTAAAPVAFDKTLELQGIRFHVSSENAGSINTLHIILFGLEVDRLPIVKTIDGTVSGAEVADLNADGSPEVYVYVTSAGSGSYGSLVAYAANRRQSLSEIVLPPLTEAAAQGYMGHANLPCLKACWVAAFPFTAQPTATRNRPVACGSCSTRSSLPKRAGCSSLIGRLSFKDSMIEADRRVVGCEDWFLALAKPIRGSCQPISSPCPTARV